MAGRGSAGLGRLSGGLRLSDRSQDPGAAPRMHALLFSIPGGTIPCAIQSRRLGDLSQAAPVLAQDAFRVSCGGIAQRPGTFHAPWAERQGHSGIALRHGHPCGRTDRTHLSPGEPQGGISHCARQRGQGAPGPHGPVGRGGSPGLCGKGPPRAGQREGSRSHFPQSPRSTAVSAGRVEDDQDLRTADRKS